MRLCSLGIYGPQFVSDMDLPGGSQTQSNLAIMSCLAMGVKLSISNPLAARIGFMCGGTSWWFSDGEMDSSADKMVSNPA